ncbi:hypothetical protein [Kitasatospora sp. NPDC127060]|uniref:hypothetical protein n=1 Tax=Kitasatospora sp. NPDC127060 TaxID=3347121 RepID=UPI00364C04E1
MDTVDARFAQLQKDVGRCHATAAALEAGTDGRQAAFDALLAAADRLLAYDAQVPGLRQEPARRTTQTIVLWTSRGTAALAALTGAAVIPGWVPWGWLILLLPILAVALDSALTPKPLAKDRPHHRHRTSAALLAACTLLLSTVALGTLSAWWLIAALGCATASFATGLPDGPSTNRSTT